MGITRRAFLFGICVPEGRTPVRPDLPGGDDLICPVLRPVSPSGTVECRRRRGDAELWLPHGLGRWAAVRRPALQAMLRYLEDASADGETIDYVIVHKLDRLARNRPTTSPSTSASMTSASA